MRRDIFCRSCLWFDSSFELKLLTESNPDGSDKRVTLWEVKVRGRGLHADGSFRPNGIFVIYGKILEFVKAKK